MTIADTMRSVQCPNCKKPVTWSKESPYRPFCSERCRIIDLGAWANESYAIPVKDDSALSDDNSDIEENSDKNDKDESSPGNDNDEFT